jgi:hypothetical protein
MYGLLRTLGNAAQTFKAELLHATFRCGLPVSKRGWA